MTQSWRGLPEDLKTISHDWDDKLSPQHPYQEHWASAGPPEDPVWALGRKQCSGFVLMSLIITLPFYVCSFSWSFEKSSHSGWCLIPPLSSATWLTLPIEMILCQFQAEASGIRTCFHLLSHASAITLRKTRFGYPLVLGGEWETCGTKWLSQA